MTISDPLPEPPGPIFNPGRDIIRLCNKYENPIDGFKQLFSKYFINLENFLNSDNQNFYYNINENINDELNVGVNKFENDLRSKEVFDVLGDVATIITSFINPLVALAGALGKTVVDISWDLIDKHQYIRDPIDKSLKIMNNPWNNDLVNCTEIYKSFFNLFSVLSKE